MLRHICDGCEKILDVDPAYKIDEPVFCDECAEGGDLLASRFPQISPQAKEEEMSKSHYFNDEAADPNDMLLNMSTGQGYVPKTCLLGGSIGWGLIQEGKDPCKGCAGPRERCVGRAK